MISYEIGKINTAVNVFKYPDGCVDIDLNTGSNPPDMSVSAIEVTAKFGDEMGINDTLVALSLTREALRHQYPLANIALFMPYLPYARQDRRERNGMAHPLKVVGKQINAMEFAYVCVADAHSTVAEACIERLHIMSQYEIFGGVKTSFREVYIVAPDAGATKKCEAFAKLVGAAGVITCAKDRVNGRIVGLKVLDKVPQNAKLFVLDDLADGAATFKYVAEALEQESNYAIDSLELAVTHGLFTKGTSVVTEKYDKVYTTDSYISDKEGCEVVELK